MKSFFLPSIALGTAALLLVPARESLGFAKLGGDLDAATQRQFRVFNNFANPEANDNQAPAPCFPGWQGAYMALWKAATEWASVPHAGTGAGDPTQSLGDTGANFDFVWAGAASAAGGTNRNVVREADCGGTGSLYAFVETPIGDGWRMNFCDHWVWSDGPGASTGGQIDLQGTGSHEFGHALGLGHSAFGNTMHGTSFDFGNDWRSIEDDDRLGVQCIYGVSSANKVEITGISVDLPADTVTITGQNFTANDNEVWFTNARITTPGEEARTIVGGAASTSGGTSITVTIPPNAYDGDAHVKADFTGHASLSNGWPVDLDEVLGGEPLAITGIDPPAIEALIPGTGQTVTLEGISFTSQTTVAVGGQRLDPASYTFVDTRTITLDMPQVGALGPVDITVDDGPQSHTAQATLVAPATPVLQVGNGDGFASNTISSADGIDVILAGPVGNVNYVLFSGSNVASSIPLVTLCLGNAFLDLDLLTLGTIGAAGYTEISVTTPPVFAIWFFQSFTLSQGIPIPTSGCQEAFLTF